MELSKKLRKCTSDRKMKRRETMSEGKEFIAILEKYIERIKPY
jgi:polyhydroxyalkanoate synthesis regulator phasin